MTPPNTPAPVDVAAVWVDEKTCRESIYVVRGLWKSAPAEVIGGICGLASEALDLRPRLAACERELATMQARVDAITNQRDASRKRSEDTERERDEWKKTAEMHNDARKDFCLKWQNAKQESDEARAELAKLRADRTALAVAELHEIAGFARRQPSSFSWADLERHCHMRIENMRASQPDAGKATNLPPVFREIRSWPELRDSMRALGVSLVPGAAHVTWLQAADLVERLHAELSADKKQPAPEPPSPPAQGAVSDAAIEAWREDARSCSFDCTSNPPTPDAAKKGALGELFLMTGQDIDNTAALMRRATPPPPRAWTDDEINVAISALRRADQRQEWAESRDAQDRLRAMLRGVPAAADGKLREAAQMALAYCECRNPAVPAEPTAKEVRKALREALASPAPAQPQPSDLRALLKIAEERSNFDLNAATKSMRDLLRAIVAHVEGTP